MLNNLRCHFDNLNYFKSNLTQVSFDIEEVIKSIKLDTWEEFKVKIPLNGEEMLKRDLGKWNVIHYDNFGRCYSLTLNEVSSGKIKIWEQFIQYLCHYYNRKCRTGQSLMWRLRL